MAESSGMDPVTRSAFERLLKNATGDSGQDKRTADFVLAWWNAGSMGGFNPIDLCVGDPGICADKMQVLGYLASRSMAVYPHEYREEIRDVMRVWRKDIIAEEEAEIARAEASR